MEPKGGNLMSPPAKRTGRAGHGEMMMQAPLLAQFSWLVHGFSTRHGGVSSLIPAGSSAAPGADLNLGKIPWDSAANVRENRRRLLARLRAGQMKLVLLRQIHSDLI